MKVRAGFVLVLALLGAHGSWSRQGAASGFDDGAAQGAGQVLRCPPGAPVCNPGPIDPPVINPDTDSCGPYSSATIVAIPSTIRQGQSATLQWAVTYPFPCTPPLIQVNGQAVPPAGTMTVTPMSSSPYALFVGGLGVRQINVYVQLPAVVRIKGNTGDWKRLFIQALQDPLPGFDAIPPAQRPGRTVLLAANVDMDLTNREGIHIGQGVTVTSELPPPVVAQARTIAGFGGVSIFDQGPVARNAFSLGPRVYTTSRPRPLFHIQCNGENIFGNQVRLSGFRIQGPHFDTEEGDENLERAIMITSCTGVEISNMEISGWSGQAIYIQDPENLISSFADVKVHDNFIHHNQHRGGNGYGVETTGGAMATIERNLFDFNRHAIAAGGGPGVGYRALKNLVLKGGGHHDTFFNEWTHQFDVHGDDNCYDIIPFYEERWWNCGNAGEAFQYIGNTFQFTNDLAIKIRGTPRIAAEIHHNVFAQDDLDDAVAPTDNHSVSVYSNTTGTDHYGQYGVCDFDGDRRDDLFMATGVTWWYSSAGKREWRFLNERPEKLGALGLGDFDGDGRCDVFTVQGSSWKISKGGTGLFTSLGTFSVPFSQLAFGDFNGDGRKDIFRRAPDGQWFAISPGVYPWTPLQSSSFPLSALRFGDFDGNGVTDVLSISGGRWAVSRDARSTWQRLNPYLSSSLASVSIGNVDGVPGDDIVRYVRADAISGRWEVSSGGATLWTTLTSFSYQDSYAARQLDPAARMRTILGRFDVWNGSDVLAIEYSRGSYLFSQGHGNLAPYGFYAY